MVVVGDRGVVGELIGGDGESAHVAIALVQLFVGSDDNDAKHH